MTREDPNAAVHGKFESKKDRAEDEELCPNVAKAGVDELRQKRDGKGDHLGVTQVSQQALDVGAPGVFRDGCPTTKSAASADVLNAEV